MRLRASPFVITLACWPFGQTQVVSFAVMPGAKAMAESSRMDMSRRKNAQPMLFCELKVRIGGQRIILPLRGLIKDESQTVTLDEGHDGFFKG